MFPIYTNRLTVTRISIKLIILDSGVAQLAEQVTVNHLVGGSSPSSGAILCATTILNLYT